MERTVNVACVQAEPVVLDREATIDRVAELAGRAAGDGAELVLFPEAFVDEVRRIQAERGTALVVDAAKVPSGPAASRQVSSSTTMT